MVDIILKCKGSDRRTHEYLKFKGGVTLLVGDRVSILTSRETRDKILSKAAEYVCTKCMSKAYNGPGIGPYCGNKDCDVADGPEVRRVR